MLRIISGPSLPHPVESTVGGGSAPILTRYKKSNFRIISPDQLPVGRLVEVRGLMVVDTALNDPTPEQKRGDVPLDRRFWGKDRVFEHEHIIVWREPPKLL